SGNCIRATGQVSAQGQGLIRAWGRFNVSAQASAISHCATRAFARIQPALPHCQIASANNSALAPLSKCDDLHMVDLVMVNPGMIDPQTARCITQPQERNIGE